MTSIYGTLAGMSLLLSGLLHFGCESAFQMARAKWVALLDYDLLASRYVNGFRGKWLAKPGIAEGELLGSADIQSLADLGNSYEVIRQMRLLPFDRRVFLRLAIVLILPLLPLTLTMFRMEEIVRGLIKMLL